MDAYATWANRIDQIGNKGTCS